MSTALATTRSGELLWESFVPKPKETLSEWADKYRVLTPEASAEPGPWRTDRAPYLREIQDVAGSPFTNKVVWVAGSQVGKTEVTLNFCARQIHRDPGPMLIVQPTQDSAKTWSTDRLSPMLRECKPLRGKVRDPRTRDSGNTILHKVFLSGHLTIVGANSAAGLSSRPIRDVVLDEVDRYPASAGTEGDPASLAIQRTRNFWNRMQLWVSSPSGEDTSRIQPEYELSDQRRYYLACPYCGHRQVLVWKNMKWETDVLPNGTKVHRAETAAYLCHTSEKTPGGETIEGGCGSLIEHREKRSMLKGGEWIAESPGGAFPGFHISALYSPWVSWAELATLWIEAQDSTEKLKAFINLQLGEVWRESQEKWESKDLSRRAEKYPKEVPHGVGVLVAAVDVQGDRLEVLVKGYGAKEESWMITHERLYGDPEQDEVWARLLAILNRPWVHESGKSLRIRASMVDSGYLTTKVYGWVRGKETSQGIYACMGTDTRQGEPLKRSTRKNTGKVKLWTIRTPHFKTIIFRRIRRTANGGPEDVGGPGYMHFCTPTKTGADAEYFTQFEAEIPTLIKVGRTFVRVFKQIRDRNEAIDLEVYALAALYSLGDSYVKKLGTFAKKWSEPAPKPDDEDETKDDGDPVTPPKKKGKRRGGWAHRYKD